MLDRIIWQDVDAARLSPGQIDVAARLGRRRRPARHRRRDRGPTISCAFPDVLLPYRPTATTDVAPGVPGRHPRRDAGRRDRPAGPVRASSSRVGRWRPSAIAWWPPSGRMASGLVTLLGFDPAAAWIAESGASDGLWRRLLPPRTAGGLVFADDNMLVSAVSQLPSLALPPVSGLIVLLGAYILLIGPDQLPGPPAARSPRMGVADDAGPGRGLHGRGVRVRVGAARQRRDRQRGRDRERRPGRDRGLRARSTSGSSRRRAADTRCACRAARCSPRRSTTSSAGQGGVNTQLDVLQGDPARVRDLAVGFGSLRTIRAETPVAVPLDRDRTAPRGRPAEGTVRNLSSERLERPAVVLGGTVATLEDLEPGAEATVDVQIQNKLFGQSLSDKVVGQIFFGDGRPERRHRGPLHPALDGRPADLRPDVRLDRAAGERRPGRPGLGLAGPAPRPDRGPGAAPARERPLLPADPDGDQRRRPRSAPT